MKWWNNIMRIGRSIIERQYWKISFLKADWVEGKLIVLNFFNSYSFEYIKVYIILNFLYINQYCWHYSFILIFTFSFEWLTTGQAQWKPLLNFAGRPPPMLFLHWCAVSRILTTSLPSSYKLLQWCWNWPFGFSK